MNPTEWTNVTIDNAYNSYHMAVSVVLLKFLNYDSHMHLRKLLLQLDEDYYYQLSIDKRQNLTPMVESPKRVILKACQYAQAALVRDMCSHYSDIVKVRDLKNRADAMIRLSPRDIDLQLQLTEPDPSELGVSYDSYINIENPQSAARIIGQLNSTDSFDKFTANGCLMDELLEERIMEAEKLKKTIQS